MATVKILLTKKQTTLLAPIFIEAQEYAGMIVGQFEEATDGEGFFEVGFVDAEKAIAIQKAIGIKPGLKRKMEHEVYTDVGEA